MGMCTGRVGIGIGSGKEKGDGRMGWDGSSFGRGGWETERQRAGAILFLLSTKENGVDKLSETRREREMKEMVNHRSNYYEKVM